MSKRITVKTNITDVNYASTALQQAGWGFVVNGNVVQITSGPCRNANIDLRTGDVSGDTDWKHTSASLGQLRQGYAEVKFRAEAFKEGVQINQRIVEKNGDVRLKCRMVASA